MSAIDKPIPPQNKNSDLKSAWQALDETLQGIFKQHSAFQMAFLQSQAEDRAEPLLPSEIANMMQLILLKEAAKQMGLSAGEHTRFYKHINAQTDDGLKSLEVLLAQKKAAPLMDNGDEILPLVRQQLSAMGLDISAHSIEPKSADFKDFFNKASLASTPDAGSSPAQTFLEISSFIQKLQATCEAQGVDFGAEISNALEQFKTALDQAEPDKLAL